MGNMMCERSFGSHLRTQPLLKKLAKEKDSEWAVIRKDVLLEPGNLCRSNFNPRKGSSKA